jgi:hypothetical protein
MAGRAGRRGIDTVGHVIHCNQLFQNGVPSIMEYKAILSGKPQKLISKFHIHYGIVMNLLKTMGPQIAENLCSFTEKSMLSREIQQQITGIEKEVDILGKKYDIKNQYFRSETEIKSSKMSPKECMRVLEIHSFLSMLPNKKKKEAEREIDILKDKYRTYEKDLSEYKDFIEVSRSLNTEKGHLLYKTEYIRNKLENCLYVLEKYGLVERNYGDNDENKDTENVVEKYSLTSLGKQSSNLAEIHPLIGSLIINKLKTCSIQQLIQIFISFTDIRVPEDNKKLACSTEDIMIKDILDEINKLIYELEDIESSLTMDTGIRYESLLNYDFTEDIIGWINATSEEECKYYIQTVVYGKEISVGDFTKAILKVSNITREFANIAEEAGEIEFLNNLSKIDEIILKYVTTSQSLYV